MTSIRLGMLLVFVISSLLLVLLMLQPGAKQTFPSIVTDGNEWAYVIAGNAIMGGYETKEAAIKARDTHNQENIEYFRKHKGQKWQGDR